MAKKTSKKAARRPAPKARRQTTRAGVPHPLAALLVRVAEALERQVPAVTQAVDLDAADAFVWHAESGELSPVKQVSGVPLHLLKGVERQTELLLANTRQHADGFPANNVLLWGARGAGKSSLIKAVHAAVNEGRKKRLAIVEIHREDIASLPRLLARLREIGRPCVLFCDDLSFEGEDQSYKALKAVLEGGLEGRPTNVVFYATSNRRHLMSRDMIENERATAIHASEVTEEKVSLSDRFGLWLGFHNLDQDTFLAIVKGYAEAFKVPISDEGLRARAIEWAMTRGGRSGRVAWQLIQQIAGELKVRIDLSKV